MLRDGIPYDTKSMIHSISNVVVVTSSVAKITFVVDEATFKVAVLIEFSGQDHVCSGCDNF